MIAHRICWSTILVVCLMSPRALGVCAVDDDDFTTEDGGCKDLTTGIVWSSDLKIEQYSRVTAENYCSVQLPNSPEGGGFTDWRLPTLREADEAVANGLNSHLDFLYAHGDQGPDSFYRYLGCSFIRRNVFTRWVYRYLDGDLDFADGGHVDGNGDVGHTAICVRGVAADYDFDCPDKKGKLPEEGPGKSGGKRKDKNSQTSALPMSALLFLPLAMVIAARWTRWRRA